MKKRKQKKRKVHNFLALNKALTYSILAVTLLLFMTGVVVVAYSLGFEDAKEKQSTMVYKIKEDNRLLRNRLKQTLGDTDYSVPDVKSHEQYQSQKSMKNIPKQTLTHEELPSTKKRAKKAKLALILDDVSFPAEVRDVKALGIKVNFSFFPVTSKHPDTARLAKKEPFYMVHLPLEAMTFSAEEPKTLRVHDSMKKMERRLAAIKRDFPRLQYVNNHTGSKFTSDYEAVKKLYKAARKHNLDIVDSRTIATTQLPEVYKDFNRKLLSRDVFLDHEADVSYICGQMKLAVNTAIRNGKAIAIGHPRRETIKALKACKSYFDAVNLVYISEL